tara:strand:- start:2282 stop:2518 length:237 start_codon:yes stop_codon:yes gene_type:complete
MNDITPIYIRPPRSGNCPYTGLSKSKIFQLIRGENPPVKSIAMRESANARGTRLIHFQSLLDYIASFDLQNSKDIEVC